MPPWWDKVPSKFDHWDDSKFRAAGFRAVPGCVVRRSAYIAPNVVLMPSFVNLGAYVDQGSMIDTWATVGSCAQIGKNCHISGGVGIGGVLEPLQAGPVIVEDNCFIGARSEVAEGVIVREGSVLSMGVFIGASTKIVDRSSGEIVQGEVPPYSVVVPGSLPGETSSGRPSPSLYCAVIVKRVDEKTRSKTSTPTSCCGIEAALAERAVTYRTLNAAEIVATIGTLEEQRIAERFPEAGLLKVCRDLIVIARETHQSRSGSRGLILRFASSSLPASSLPWLLPASPFDLWHARDPSTDGDRSLRYRRRDRGASPIWPCLQSGALLFAVTLEDRFKRRESLRDLHVFRSFAHVIDMHQLTKDPATLLGAGPDTASSPKRTMSKYELTRYLDYCSEMQSLTGKLAALYAQNVPDPVVIDAVKDIEDLTANFSRKVWQKISILGSYNV